MNTDYLKKKYIYFFLNKIWNIMKKVHCSGEILIRGKRYLVCFCAKTNYSLCYSETCKTDIISGLCSFLQSNPMVLSKPMLKH